MPIIAVDAALAQNAYTTPESDEGVSVCIEIVQEPDNGRERGIDFTLTPSDGVAIAGGLNNTIISHFICVIMCAREDHLGERAERII